jgi:hypothetical protein
VESFGILIVAWDRIRGHSVRIPGSNGWQSSLVFLVPGVLLFGVEMSVACINCFSTGLRDRPGSLELRGLGPEMLADHALRRGKCLLEHVRCDVLAGIGTRVLNKLMGTTGRVSNVGWERRAVMSRGAGNIYRRPISL